MQILRVFNNNVVLARDEHRDEVVLTGRGLGFQAKPGQQVDEAKVVRVFVPDDGRDPELVGSLVAAIRPEHLVLADQALDIARAELAVPPSVSTVIALTDHLSFAIKRVRKGIPMEFPCTPRSPTSTPTSSPWPNASWVSQRASGRADPGGGGDRGRPAPSDSQEPGHSIGGMLWGSVELEPEVRSWLETLERSQFATAAFYIDLLAEQGPLLGEPYTRQLDGKLRELRFYLTGRAVRVTYWVASGRRIVLLTVFVKSRMREVGEIERAQRALQRCLTEKHSVDEEE